MDPAAVARQSVTEYLGESTDRDAAPAAAARQQAAGLLVHRLFESAHADTLLDDALATHAHELLEAEERSVLDDAGATVRTAIAAWRALKARPEVTALLGSGRREHEVAFSLRIENEGVPVLLRGRIDCLVHRPDGSIAVVEFKAGRPRGIHRRQLDVYVAAVRHLFPGAEVEGHLLYAD